LTKQERISNGKKTVFSTNAIGKLDSNMQKEETEPLSYTIYKNEFRRMEDLNVRPETIKILEESIRQ